MTDLKSVDPKGRTGSTPVPATNSNQTTMYVLDYPEFVSFEELKWIKNNLHKFFITVNHPVIRYFGVNENGEAYLFDKDEEILCMLPLVTKKKDGWNSFEGGDAWVGAASFSYSSNKHLNCNNWDVVRGTINQLITKNDSSRFAVAAIFVYQQLKHKYEMENLTREFSNFRKSFDEKLDKIISTIIKEPSEPTTTSTVEKVVEKKLEPKPKLELKDKPKRTSPAFTTETIWKSCKNIGIAKTAVKFEITEDEVRKLKKEYKK